MKRILLLATISIIAFQTISAQITEFGLASFYADKFDGRITASGDIFDQKQMTGAHRTLPFGSKVKVTNLDNNQSVVVTINDRGPFVNDRIIDISKAAATKLDFTKLGVTKVKLEVISIGKTSTNMPKPATTKPTPVKTASDPIVENTANIYYAIDANIIESAGFGVQIASFQEAANLMQRCYEIRTQINEKVIVQVGESHGAQIYRIIVGHFQNINEAQKYKETISSKFNGCFVVEFK